MDICSDCEPNLIGVNGSNYDGHSTTHFVGVVMLKQIFFSRRFFHKVSVMRKSIFGLQ